MNNVPFLYVNLIAMCGYAIIFISFIAAKKTSVVKTFVALLVSFILWTGGSILMRLQVAPGLTFWYYVSILALFCIADLTYIFVCSFTKTKGVFLKIVWSAGTFIILILTGLGLFLKPPAPVQTDAGTVFMYDVGWTIAIPYAFFACIVASIVVVIRRSVRKTGTKSPGMNAMIAGCIIIAFGNMLQLIPGNIFPWDTLSGIIAAAFLVYSLYKKRMFRLTLLVSRGVVVFASVFICLVIVINYVESMINGLHDLMHISHEAATSIVVVIAVGIVWLCYMLLSMLMDALFTRQEQQERLIKIFSESATQTLDSHNIMKLMADTIQTEITAEEVYICMLEEGEFKFKYVSSPLSDHQFVLREDIPLVDYAKVVEPCFTMKDFRGSTHYLSMWDSEKLLFNQLSISCIMALAEQEAVVGFVLLSKKDKNNTYTSGDMNFLSTISSIAAIAMKNASLFEQVAREARTDAMTGVYNYRYFTKAIAEEFDKKENECLALLFVDIDDFKLYNQLYGANEGDEVLKKTASIIEIAAGENGQVFRYSGKVFAVILPGYDARRAKTFAENIREEIAAINDSDFRSSYKKITASCGICVTPYAASSVGELVDNTDLAVYKAKNNGKDQVLVFTGNDTATFNLRKRVEKIIETNKDSVLGDSSQAIFALIAAIDAKDHYTAQHSKNVAKYAAILSAANNMSEDQIRMVYAAGLLHDIGKISIPENILKKEENLNDEEYEIIKGHVNSSIDMIRHLPSMDYLIPAAVGHHERWDGKGYPRGTAGEDIPVAARCLAIADSFDAMTTDRPYRKELSIDYAREQIEAGAGTQFDPELAELFIQLINDMEIVLNKGND
ncbi:MAG: diguanylate cyclase [Bacillota bacterium]|nr:diguanylate cyclase [Bacillota bacterium]